MCQAHEKLSNRETAKELHSYPKTLKHAEDFNKRNGKLTVIFLHLKYLAGDSLGNCRASYCCFIYYNSL